MSKISVDTARLPLLLHELRQPAVNRLWRDIVARADEEGWLAICFLSALVELEVAKRARHRIERHLAESRLPTDKTLDSFDFNAVPMLSKAHVVALASGDIWLGKGANPLLFGPPGSGKGHVVRRARPGAHRERLPCAIYAHHRYSTALQAERQALHLAAAISKLDRFDVLVLDDLSDVSKDQAGTGVLFELIAACYERRSLMITANQPFGNRSKVFHNPAMTVANIDRFVHHATIFEMNVEIHRRRTAAARKTKAERRSDGKSA
jgi:DNA replication protein DnaC